LLSRPDAFVYSSQQQRQIELFLTSTSADTPTKLAVVVVAKAVMKKYGAGAESVGSVEVAEISVVLADKAAMAVKAMSMCLAGIVCKTLRFKGTHNVGRGGI
jgi:hypothetical protein